MEKTRVHLEAAGKQEVNREKWKSETGDDRGSNMKGHGGMGTFVNIEGFASRADAFLCKMGEGSNTIIGKDV